MRTFIKSLGFIFLAILILQLTTLPSYRTISQRDPYTWPPKKGVISGYIAVRKHQGNTVKGFIISKDGRTAKPFSAHQNALKGPAAFQLKQFDKMMQRRKTLAWSVPMNLLLIIFGFWMGDFWEKRHPAPGHATEAPATTPEDDFKSNLSSKLEHARLKKQSKEDNDSNNDDDDGVER